MGPIIRIPIDSRADMKFCPARGAGEGTGSVGDWLRSGMLLAAEVPVPAGGTSLDQRRGQASRREASPLHRGRHKTRELIGMRILPIGPMARAKDPAREPGYRLSRRAGTTGRYRSASQMPRAMAWAALRW